MAESTLASLSLQSALRDVSLLARSEGSPATEAAGQSRPEATPAVSQPARPAPADVFRNIRLQFKINPKTNDVTVLMVDVNAHKVVRSIPAEDLQRLDQGELVQLLA